MPRKGGKAIASGSYGCVFRPALKCKNGKDGENKGVSKLMFSEDANQEMDEMEPIAKKLKNLPNKNKYFALSGTSMCTPDKLNENDKEQFNDKCNLFVNENITSSNINSNLSDLSIINMPDLGRDLHDYIGETNMTDSSIKKFNSMMINLLNNGVVPMNENKVVHHDLKDTNIMVDANDNTIIIDWGFAGVSYSTEIIPKNILGRPLQYNTPFSSMLINGNFIKEYKRACENSGAKVLGEKQNIIFLKKYLEIHIKRNPGHEKYLAQSIPRVFKGKTFSEMFLRYNANVLEKFTNGCNFYYEEYFKDVYIYNVDVWGACTTFMQFISHPDLLANLSADFRKKVQDIYMEILTMCFTNGAQRIDVNKIVMLLGKIALPNTTVSSKKKTIPFPEIPDAPVSSLRGEDSIKKTSTDKKLLSQKTKQSSRTKKRRKRCPNGYRRHPKTKRCTIMSGPDKGKEIDTPSS